MKWPDSKFIRFAENGPDCVDLINKRTGSFLGSLTYFQPWKQWVFAPDGGTVFDSLCLMAITQALTLLHNKQVRDILGLEAEA